MVKYDLLQYGFTQFAMPIIVLLCMSLEVTEITMKAASQLILALEKKLESNQLNSLPDEPLNGCKFSPLTYPQLGDDMFQLKI